MNNVSVAPSNSFNVTTDNLKLLNDVDSASFCEVYLLQSHKGTSGLLMPSARDENHKT